MFVLLPPAPCQKNSSEDKRQLLQYDVYDVEGTHQFSFIERQLRNSEEPCCHRNLRPSGIAVALLFMLHLDKHLDAAWEWHSVSNSLLFV